MNTFLVITNIATIALLLALFIRHESLQQLVGDAHSMVEALSSTTSRSIRGLREDVGVIEAKVTALTPKKATTTKPAAKK